MSRNTPQPDPEDIHKDLLATMAASRELGPDMDKALVESYMERHPELKGAPQQAQALTQPQPTNRPDLLGFSGMGVMMIGYITLLIVTHGELWWMFWPMMAWGGWRWGNGGRHAEHQRMRQARWEARMNRYGMPYVRVGGPDDAQQPRQPPAIAPTPPTYAPPSPPLATPPLATPPMPSSEAPVHAPSTLPPINPAG
ncbi:MAG TPA: hypothetical protein VJN88_03015 [Ktedonobacterales bacterium]|nr:hypothetical protein [Ktedonobacterales bacterium]